MVRQYLLSVILGGIFLSSVYGQAKSAGSAVKMNSNYGRPFETKVLPAFITLPPGAVEPQGWLRDWCLTAKDGYTGHMDEIDVAFRQAWAANYTMNGERLDWPEGGWPYEGGGYWFDGMIRLGYVLHDDSLIQQAKRRLDVVVNHMNSNSILFMWWLNKKNPGDLSAARGDTKYPLPAETIEWPFWANGLFGRSLVGYYAASGNKHVLKALETAYSGDPDWLRMGWGMSNPWPAFETYTWTGNKEIAAGLSRLFSKDGGGKNQQRDSWNRYRRMPDSTPGAEENDHGVHFLESTTPWALGYLWTGNREFLETAIGWSDLLEREAMQPYGVLVSDEFCGPAGALRGTETCDVSAYLWSQTELLRISGQGARGDRIERAFFNAAPAVVSRDFNSHVYTQMPNRITPGNNGYNYQKKQWPLCCTASLNRMLPNYVVNMWMATYDNGLAATCYGPCKVSALVSDHVPVELICRTDYPFNDVIEITVNLKHQAAFPLSFRIPRWCKDPSIMVNGSIISMTPDTSGFVRIEQPWKSNDRIRLQFPMPVRVTTGRDSNADGAPYATVSYGPLLFALPIPYTINENTPDSTAKWNYALDTQGELLGSDITVERKPMPARWNWPAESPLKLHINVVSFDWNGTTLPGKPISDNGIAPKKTTLIPYGCTQFRVSMFPVTERTYHLSFFSSTTIDPSAPDYTGRKGTSIYVSKSGNNSDGSSWDKAYHSIQAALLAIPDDTGGHRIIIRPDTYVEANLYPANKGAQGAYNLLIGDSDGSLGSGATGRIIIDAGDPQKGFKSYDWWGTMRSTAKGWRPEFTDQTFSSICWDRWIFRNLYTSGSDAGFFWDLTDKSGEGFTVIVEDCVGIGRAFGGGICYPVVRPDEPSIFRRSYFLALDWVGDTGAILVGGWEATMPAYPHLILEDCTLVHPDNALAMSYASNCARVRAVRCRMIVLNFTQPEIGGKSTGIICTQGHRPTGKLHVDLEDCILAGYRVFTSGEDGKAVSYTTKGEVQAYVQFTQPVPEGFERITLWPDQLFDFMAIPKPLLKK